MDTLSEQTVYTSIAILFGCGLVNVVVSSSVYVMSNDTMNSELENVWK
jgi:heme/copper-type cytochrome/quinol oxidase subunit 4